MTSPRDHGGGLDFAIAKYGGQRADWIDLSTGINPVPYPIEGIPDGAWSALPDHAAKNRLIDAARAFWNVPKEATIVPAPGASSLIARLPAITDGQSAYIPGPTYNEHAASFSAHGRLGTGEDQNAQVHVYVHPNNPDGRLWPAKEIGGRSLTIVDESFCDVMPAESHIGQSSEDGIIVLKSFGKFWGLAGLRLGFAIGAAKTMRSLDSKIFSSGVGIEDLLGPWAVSGPALEIGARALSDVDWAIETRKRLAKDRGDLDDIMAPYGNVIGGTDLYGLYDVPDARTFQDRLAKAHIWTRVFPYSDRWIRLGLPHPNDFDRVKQALKG